MVFLITSREGNRIGIACTPFHKYGIVPCDNVVDSMGAGDSYIAGFLFGKVEGLSLEECMHKGAANATETLKYFGAW